MVENIRKLCEAAGITINQLEKATGLGRGTIYRWDEKNPGVDKASAVAEYFSVTLDQLYNGDDIEVDNDLLALRERLRRQPGMRILFDAADGATAAQLEAVAKMIETWKES